MLKPRFISFLLLCSLAAMAPLTARAASIPPLSPEDRQVNQLIEGMRDASTWGHPDQFGQYKGMVAFSDGRYKKAMYLFKIGARYADKVSQLSIGLMYLNGQGVTRDPVRAWAWVAISAERDYPAFEATRDRIWKTLSADQQKQAEAIRETLARTYGDAVAKRRMASELAYFRSQITGSLTGHDSGIRQAAVGPSGTPSGACLRAARVGLRATGCGSPDMYAPENWDPKIYFKVRDAQYKGTVTVGALQKGKGDPVPAKDQRH